MVKQLETEQPMQEQTRPKTSVDHMTPEELAHFEAELDAGEAEIEGGEFHTAEESIALLKSGQS